MRKNNYLGLLVLILLIGLLKHSTAAQQKIKYIDKLNVLEISEIDTNNELHKHYHSILEKPFKNRQGNNHKGKSQGIQFSKVKKGGLSQIKPSSELHCLALNIYFEARSESKTGQLAVGHVVMNRLAHPTFPGSVCGVVKQGGEQRLNRCQFSWWCDGVSDKPVNLKAWKRSLRVAREIYSRKSKDPTGGALWYHADNINPYWQSAFLQGPIIGRHVFYLDKGKRNS